MCRARCNDAPFDVRIALFSLDSLGGPPVSLAFAYIRSFARLRARARMECASVALHGFGKGK